MCVYIYTVIFFFFIQKEKVLCVFIHICMYRYRKVATLSLLWRNHGQQDRRQYLHKTGNTNLKKIKIRNKRDVVVVVFQKRCHDPLLRRDGAQVTWHSTKTSERERERSGGLMWCSFIKYIQYIKQWMLLKQAWSWDTQWIPEKSDWILLLYSYSMETFTGYV